MDNPFLVAFSISIFGLVFLFINVVIFFKTFKKNSNDKSYKNLVVYLSVYFIIELACNIIGYIEPNSNIFVSHFAFNIQFILLSLFFYSLFKKQFLKKLVIIVYIVFLITNALFYYNDSNLFWEFNLFEIVFSSFLIIIYTLIHIYNSLEEVKSYFYFTIGVSTYMLTSSVIFLSGNLELVFIEEPYIDIWVFNSLFFIVYQSLIYKEWKYIKSSNLNE